MLKGFPSPCGKWLVSRYIWWICRAVFWVNSVWHLKHTKICSDFVFEWCVFVVAFFGLFFCGNMVVYSMLGVCRVVSMMFFSFSWS